MSNWYCGTCGFGPHNSELHAACIECGKYRAGSGRHSGKQSHQSHQDKNTLVVLPEAVEHCGKT
ncbi:hypothetical protein DFP73DRAFT_470017 [Morchella snyderi]|nr:hypothetical protein DFP73DRAFT_470017 [Morchella snyderi]